MDSSGEDHARPMAPTGSRPSRRAFLGMAGALGAAGAAFQLPPVSAAEAAVALRRPAVADSAGPAVAPQGSVPLRPFAGADQSAFGPMLKGTNGSPILTPPPTAIRWYIDTHDYPNKNGGYGGPKLSWPNISNVYGSPAHALVSIRPDIGQLNSGAFDAELSAFMKQAPAGTASLLTIWHECATFNLTNSNYPQDPEAFVAALTHLQKLAAGKIGKYPSTNVKVGVVDVNPSALRLKHYSFKPKDAQAVYNVWMAANLDWYGCDLYDNHTYNVSAFDELNNFRACVNQLPGSVEKADWPVNIPEINSPVDTKHNRSTIPVTENSPTGFRRSDFYHYAWTWLRTIGPASHCSGLLGFWNGGGHEGSPWPPPNTPKGSQPAMVKVLEAMNAQSWP